MWQALTLLEEGLTHSPSNAQFKLLLVRIYCVLGAFEPVVDLYSSLDAKHIQHDTIGLVVYTLNSEQLATSGWGPYTWSSSFSVSVIKLFRLSIPPMMTHCKAERFLYLLALMVILKFAVLKR